jgi:hypothetical protein
MLTGTGKLTSACWRALGTSVGLWLPDPGALAQARVIVEACWPAEPERQPQVSAR